MYVTRYLLRCFSLYKVEINPLNIAEVHLYCVTEGF